jgi:hypothetical protein
MLQPVRLLGVPVETFLRSAQHADDVVRELWLISVSHNDRDDYRRLSHAAERCLHTGAELRQATLARVLRARAEGRDTIDLELLVPPRMMQATLDWDSVLDELGALCRAGVLLTLPGDRATREFRRWYVGETVRQLQHGQRATAYDQWCSHGWSADTPQPTGA